jgi:tRNA (cmo5U34)-methyltransferase
VCSFVASSLFGVGTDPDFGPQAPRRERGGYEWLSPDKAADYLARERSAERQVELGIAHGLMLDLIPRPRDHALRFMDLGAGAGAVSRSILVRFPAAAGILVEFSAPMMRAGAEALAGFGDRAVYVEHDMNAEHWPTPLRGPFEAVVSARAIHHLDNRVMRQVFKNVHSALEPGGVFVNWDLYRTDGDEAGADPDEWTLATVGEQLDLLLSAGFVDVACPHVLGHRAIFVGRRP